MDLTLPIKRLAHATSGTVRRWITSSVSMGLGLLGLAVQAAPVIVSGPDHAVLSFGSVNGTPAEFSIVATGAAPLTYQWFRRDQTFNFAGKVTSTVILTYPDRTNASFTITNGVWALL